MNTLIIEDDEFLAECIRKSLKRKGTVNRIRILNSYESFIGEAHTLSSYDVVLVDIWLGDALGKTGVDIIKYIRTKNQKIPLIVVSGFSDISRIKNSFSAGANDYIIKPFRIQELEVRVMRWFEDYFCSLSTPVYPKISYFDIIFDIRRNAFYRDNKEIILTKTGKYILSLFLSSPERIVSESYLREKVWGDIFGILERNIKIHIFRLKKRLEIFGLSERIINVRGEGYMLRKP